MDRDPGSDSSFLPFEVLIVHFALRVFSPVLLVRVNHLRAVGPLLAEMIFLGEVLRSGRLQNAHVAQVKGAC